MKLDRIALEDVGPNPQRLAQAIHQQLGEHSGPIPVHAIARALDIVEIREERLANIEAALVTTPERGEGSILVNINASSQRRRFSIGHELGHFLNPWHRPISPDGFCCSRSDMIQADIQSQNQHRRQEAEANSFAIELLAPRKRMRRYLQRDADLQHALEMAEELDISREAAARRYVSLHDENLGVVFSRDNRFLYAAQGLSFPSLCLRRGMAMPRLPGTRLGSLLSDLEEAAPDDWIYKAAGTEIMVQTLHQQSGFATTLLRILASEEDEPDALEDAFQRFARFEER